MKVEVKKLDQLKREVKVEIKGAEFLKEKNEFYLQNSKKLKVPGFRPGSAPLEVIEKHHGKLLKEEFLKQAVPDFYRKAIEESKIIPAGLPRIYDLKFDSDSLNFSAEFEAKPEIEVKEDFYKGIKIKDYKVQVKAIDIEKVLTNLKDSIKKSLGKDLKDSDLAKWASYPDIDSFKEAIKNQLYLEKTRERRQKVNEEIRSHLLKAFKINLPKSEVDRHYEELLNREIHSLQYRGMSKEDIDKYKKELQEKLKPVAQEEVKLFYILEAIAKNENIKLDNNFSEVVFGFILSQANY